MTVRVSRVDINQKEVVNALKNDGWSVALAHPMGRGFPDLVVAKDGHTFLVEVKDGSGRLTPQQQTFHSAWRGTIIVARSGEDAIHLCRLALSAVGSHRVVI